MNENLKLVARFLEKSEGTNPARIQGVCMNDFPIVEELDQVSIFL